MTERNVELLQQTMQHVLDHPEAHDQGTFVSVVDICGTTACFAGWAALLSGWSVGRIRQADMYYVGARLLGLSSWEAMTLFYSSNTRRELELMVKDLVNGDELRSRPEYRDEANPLVSNV